MNPREKRGLRDEEGEEAEATRRDRSTREPFARAFESVARVIRELAEQELSNAEIAKRVNEMGLTTSRGKAWTRETARAVRTGKVGGHVSMKRRKAS